MQYMACIALVRQDSAGIHSVLGWELPFSGLNTLSKSQWKWLRIIALTSILACVHLYQSVKKGQCPMDDLALLLQTASTDALFEGTQILFVKALTKRTCVTSEKVSVFAVCSKRDVSYNECWLFYIFLHGSSLAAPLLTVQSTSFRYIKWRNLIVYMFFWTIRLNILTQNTFLLCARGLVLICSRLYKMIVKEKKV